MVSGQYSIKDLEKLSGIKAHTIRMWERRYNIIKPDRNCSNYRCYCDKELKRLLNIATLNNNGYKISQIARLNDNEINEELLKVVETDSSFQTQIDELLVAVIELDCDKFEETFARNVKRLGLEETFVKIIYPLLIKVGLMWQTSQLEPCQEHFLSNLIRQKLIVAIDRQYKPQRNTKSFLLFLPEGELHELGLLFYTYLIKKRDFRAIYLGQSVPYDNLLRVIEKHKPDYLLTAFVTSFETGRMKQYLENLASDCTEQGIFVTGSACEPLAGQCPQRVRYLKTVLELRDELEQMRN